MPVWPEDDLNVPQRDAITEAQCVFLVACPGSGKTRTLTYKIVDELERLASRRQCVVAITYTNRAAEEVKERIEKLGVSTSQLWIGTIHSFCLEWILRPYGVYHSALQFGFTVLSSHESEELLTDLCAPHRASRVSYWDCGFYFTKDGYQLTCQDRRKHDIIHGVLEEYFQSLAEQRKIDFELMLSYAYALVCSTPSIAKLLANLFPLILVDEYQDTKEIQYSIISKILAAGQGATKAFVVGDPNQAIFQSLGGYAISPEALSEMSGQTFKVAALTHNYRSSERIVEYFGRYDLYGAEVEPASADKKYPSIVTYDTDIGKERLEDRLVGLIRHNIDSLGIKPSEICVLAPQWVHLAGMTRRLVGRMPDLEFDGPGMVPFARDYDNFWYKLARIALTSSSPSMYLRRLRWAREVITDLASAGVATAGITPKTLLRESNSIVVEETVGLEYVRTYFDALFSRFGVDFASNSALFDHYTAFFDSSTSRVTRLAKEGSEFIGDIDAFRRVFRDRSGVTLSTIHGIKGDEYDTVIAYGLLQGMVPHFGDPRAQESAKRLLYVIASRARKNLHLVSELGRRDGLGNPYGATQVLRECRFDYDRLDT
ncbi:MAG TPA: ATP-dependent helicase [Lysobacter sp.]